MKKDFCFPLHCMLIIVTLHSGCSEFNRPVTLDTFFSYRAKNSVSEVWLELSPSGTQVNCKWYDTGSKYAKFFLKERKENEFIAVPLSSLPVDLRADIHIRDLNSESNGTSSYIEYFDKNENKIGGEIIGDERDFLMTFKKFDAVSHIQVYFWQFEIYSSSDTVRLPETPGIWCIQSEVRFVDY
jgi:hypothetical protein